MEYTLLSAAETVCAPDWSWVSDWNGWTGYHLWSVTAGQAKIRKNGEIFDLLPGDCFFFDLNQNHICTHDPANPLHVETVHLDASRPPEIRQYHIRGSQILQQAIHTCIIRANSGLDEQARGWLAAAVGEFTVPPRDSSSSRRQLVSLWCSWIDSCSDSQLSLDALCRRAGYSKSQLIRVFRQQTGKTPYRYFMESRIRRSISMLLYTNCTLEQIASAAGFYDAAHFSRSFKQITGASPQSIRSKGPL